ncbi:MAG: ABC transporter ATP-binding protein [Spirochaetes bacterium]|nr:ABC transporter ATP-binding protein [Spirochaetota bacterium]
MNILSLNDVSISFNNRKILNYINLEIKSACILTISGKSGSGKTTLLSVLSGLLKPDSGKVFFKGKDIYKWADFRRSGYRNKKIGFIYQSFNLLPDYSIYQNIIYPGILNYSSSSIKEHADYLIKYLDIDNIKDQLPSTVSGGEKQRASIARAMINSPEVILADEPTGNLDADTSKSIFSLFKDIHKKYGIAIIITTHDNYIIKNSDFHFTLVNGSIVKKR